MGMKIDAALLQEMLIYADEEHEAEMIRVAVLCNWEDIDECEVEVRNADSGELLGVIVGINAEAFERADEVVKFILSVRNESMCLTMNWVSVNLLGYRSGNINDSKNVS